MAVKKKTKKPAPAKKAAAKKSASKPAMKKPAAKQAAAPKAEAKKPTLPRLENFLTPLEDRVVVQPDAAEETTAGGLYIPGNAQEGPARGTVLAKGPGHRNKKGKIRPLDVEVGDRVLFSEYAGTKLTFSNAQILILREEDILGVVL